MGALEPPTPGQMNAVRPEELPKLVQDIEGYTGSPVVRLGLQLLMLTFVRPGALVSMRWCDVDAENRVWVVPASAMKLKKADKNRIEGEHLVPLSDWAMAILEELKDYSGDGVYVFPSSRNPAVPMNTDDLLYGLYALNYRGKMSTHGFRAVASTVLNEQRGLGLHSFSPEIIEKQLAHKEPNKVKGAYNRAMYMQERQDLMDYWSNYLEGLRHGKQEPPSAKAETKVIMVTVPKRARRGLGASLMCFAL
jgi:integrase